MNFCSAMIHPGVKPTDRRDLRDFQPENVNKE